MDFKTAVMELRAIDPSDEKAVADAEELLSVFGADYLTREKLLHHARHHVVVGAFSGRELAGLVVAHALGPGDFEALERRMGGERLESLSLPGGGGTGTVDAVAVRKEFRRMGAGHGPGVGTRLLEVALERLKESGCELLFGESWVSGSPDNSKNLAVANGCELKFEIPGYWGREGEYCPTCESTECRCTALIFVKPL